MSDPSCLRETLKAILQRDEFQTPKDWSWLDRLWDFWREISARRAQPQLQAEHFSLDFLNWVGLVILGIATFFLLYYFGKIFLPEKMVKLRTGRPKEKREDFAALKAKADSAVINSHYLEAVRLYYLAALEYLQASRVLTADPSRSDRESLQEIRRNVGPDGACYQSFSRLVRLFQEKWYGLKRCTKDDTAGAAEYLRYITMEKG
ncbi:MAG TPA: hypothetical protein VIL66_08120 [Bacillota bacterium]